MVSGFFSSTGMSDRESAEGRQKRKVEGNSNERIGLLSRFFIKAEGDCVRIF